MIIRNGIKQRDINYLIDVLGQPISKARKDRIRENDYQRIEKLREIRNRE